MRLTSDKKVSDMSMIELAHNSCYADDERNARYRDYDLDIDARKLVRNLVKDICDEDLIDLSNEEFDEYMGSMLSVGMDSTIGLLALFYRNLWAMANLRETLKKYEDLKEQGRLIKLPCKIGDDVWFVPSRTCYKLNILNNHSERNRIYHQKVVRITFSGNGWYMECDKDLECATDHILIDKMYKETWFLTKSEAEAKLKELSKIPSKMGLIKKAWAMQTIDKQKTQDNNNNCNCQHNSNSRDNEPCCRCDSKPTNANRIRSMTDEELAEFLCKVKSDYQWMEHEFPSEEEHGEWEEWLKLESEG